MGFKNFPMDRFGVQKPSLKALARTPIMPDVQVGESETMVDTVSYWQGAAVQGLTGQAYSAVGVSEEDGGVYLKDVAPYTFAATGGLQTGDVVQFVNGESVRTTTELLEVTNRAQPGPLKIGYVRKQKKATLVLKTYICVVTESTNTVFHDIRILPADKVLDFKDVTTTPDTSNDPLAVLHDGKLSESYGPVFGNGITLGTYNVDLGADVLVSEISTWSFNMNENRGRQRFTLFGTSKKNTPKNNRIPIVTVDTTAGPDGKFTASKVRTNDAESLGSYRWIEWVVQPISDQEENTAFQEFQIR